MHQPASVVIVLVKYKLGVGSLGQEFYKDTDLLHSNMMSEVKGKHNNIYLSKEGLNHYSNTAITHNRSNIISIIYS